MGIFYIYIFKYMIIIDLYFKKYYNMLKFNELLTFLDMQYASWDLYFILQSKACRHLSCRPAIDTHPY